MPLIYELSFFIKNKTAKDINCTQILLIKKYLNDDTTNQLLGKLKK